MQEVKREIEDGTWNDKYDYLSEDEAKELILNEKLSEINWNEENIEDKINKLLNK